MQPPINSTSWPSAAIARIFSRTLISPNRLHCQAQQPTQWGNRSHLPCWSEQRVLCTGWCGCRKGTKYAGGTFSRVEISLMSNILRFVDSFSQEKVYSAEGL